MAKIQTNSIIIVSEFALDPKLIEYIQTAKTDFAAQCSTLDVDHLEYFTYNKRSIKDKKLSPDAILQLSIQVGKYSKPGLCLVPQCFRGPDKERYSALFPTISLLLLKQTLCCGYSKESSQ